MFACLSARLLIVVVRCSQPGHDAYYGIAGNLRSLLKVHRAVERYWRKMLSRRSWHGAVA